METSDLAAKGQKKVLPPKKSNIWRVCPHSFSRSFTLCQLQMFLAKNKGASEVQSKSLEETATSASNSSATTAPNLASPGAPVSQSTFFSESVDHTPVPLQHQPSHSDALVQSLAPAAPGIPASPIPTRASHASHASIFSSPLTCSSPAAVSAGDTALLSAQVIDLRRRLADCERDKDANSHEHAIRMREALEEVSVLKIELQGVRDQAFEESEALRVLHQQALQIMGAEISRLKLDANVSHSQIDGDAQQLHAIEEKLADSDSRLEVAQEKLLEQTTLCSRAQARVEELQSIITNQSQEISSLDNRLNSSLVTFQQRERDLEHKIHTDSLSHMQVVADLQSHITILEAELKDCKLAMSTLQQEIEILRDSSKFKTFDDSISAAAEAEKTKLHFLLQESIDKSTTELSKLRAESDLKEEQLSAARLELIASHAALSEATSRESNLMLQVQSLQLQLNQNKMDVQVQKSAVSSPAILSSGDSTALEVSSRRVADIERKYFFIMFIPSCLFIVTFDSGMLHSLLQLVLVKPSFLLLSRKSSPAYHFRLITIFWPVSFCCAFVYLF
jgi:hypothetical protein